MPPPDIVVVMCTCPPGDQAGFIARTLVEEGHAACVNRLPGVTSTYRWQGQVEQSEETLLLIKTSRERYAALQSRLAQIHPYELPEIIAVPITTGLPAYLQWVADPEG